MSNWEIYAYATFGVLFFLLFMTYIYPKYFSKPKGGKIWSPMHRPKPEIIDGNIPGGRAEVEGHTTYDNGKMTLYLRNRNGAFVKEYVQEEVTPLNIAQALADSEAPLYITRETKYSKSEYEKDIKESLQREHRAIADADHWKKEFEALKANVDHMIDTQVKRVTDLSKSNKPDWNQTQR